MRMNWPWAATRDRWDQKLAEHLPSRFAAAHDFSFLLHDLMVELLRSGEEHNIFRTAVHIKDSDERLAFEQSGDLFEWLAKTQRTQERADILRVVVFPAVLSDMLHFVYEALDCSRKAKLNVTYALLRKPLQ